MTSHVSAEEPWKGIQSDETRLVQMLDMCSSGWKRLVFFSFGRWGDGWGCEEVGLGITDVCDGIGTYINRCSPSTYLFGKRLS